MKRKNRFYEYEQPSYEETLAKFDKQAMSKFPLRLMGNNKDIYMMEEERDGNFHIIGTSGHGKSKYLEYQIRKDIDMGFGLCLIDPSNYAATFHAVLEYCAYKNHKKVCIIDPATLYDYGKIACINPFDPKYPTKSVQSVQDAINIVFGSSILNTPRIQDNLRSLFRMLAAQNMTLHESAYFTEYDLQKDKWGWILNQATGTDKNIIDDKFKTKGNWNSEFSTTITRLNMFRSEPLSLIIGATKGVDFVKLIDEGWIILCNLYPTHIDRATSNFLGTLLISQINRAIEILNEGDEKFGDKGKRFYLYIDEAGRFMTPQIENIVSYDRKSGFNVYLAHHYIGQIKNPELKEAVNNQTNIKIMFHLADEKNRLEMIKQLGFGGKISPQEASYKYSNLPKRHFLIKKGKEYTVETTAPFIEPPDFKGNKQQIIEKYIRERLEDDWYLFRFDIEKQIKDRLPNERIHTTTTNNPSSEQTTVSDSKTTSNTPKAKPNSLFDLGAKADEFIRNKRDSKKND